MIRRIAGRHNHALRLARKLQKKVHRREHGLLLAEGMDVLAAAWEAGAVITEVLVREDLLEALPPALRQRAVTEAEVENTAPLPGYMTRPPRALNVGVVDAELLEWASSLGGGADVVFICMQPRWSLGDISLGTGVTLFLDGLGDPGNVGTLVRCAVAFGASGVCCSPGTADPYGPKAMRAGMGAQFVIPVVTDVTPSDMKLKLGRLEARGQQAPAVWVAVPHGGEDIADLVPAGNGVVLVLGAERTGPSSEWADGRLVTVPQKRLDSLNVAMAGTVLLYELSRR